MATQSIPAHVLTFPQQPQIPKALALEHEGILHLSRTLAYAIHATTFDLLTVDERIEIVNCARMAWHTTQDVLAGKAAPIPQWERACLTFSGPYDLALIEPQIDRGSEWQ
jgi:hypothetical protein